MFIERFQSLIYHVGVVDLIHHGTKVYERSFASSEQLIDWLKLRFQTNPTTALIAVRRGNRGEMLPPMPDYTYTPENGDIEVGRKFTYAQHGLQYRELAFGSG